MANFVMTWVAEGKKMVPLANWINHLPDLIFFHKIKHQMTQVTKVCLWVKSVTFFVPAVFMYEIGTF